MKTLNEIVAAVRRTAPLFERIKTAKLIEKGDFNYVTSVDIDVQHHLEAELSQIIPAQFLGEEEDGERTDWSKPAWVVDPVDGTTNLMHGYNHSAVSVAYWDGEAVLYGVVFDPDRNEMFWAKRGEGAFFDGQRIYVSKTKTLKDSLIAIETAPYVKELAPETFGLYAEIYRRCRDIRCSGSSALDFSHFACGRVDATFSRTLCPWDIAAGALIAAEAGGVSLDWDGKPSDITRDKSDVVAVNPDIRDELMEIVVNRAKYMLKKD